MLGAVERTAVDGIGTHARVGNRGGGYGWTRTTDPSIMSAVL